jgi:hypothetical protein
MLFFVFTGDRVPRQKRTRQCYTAGMETSATPTAYDHDIARVRREIAERQQAEYDECLGWALHAFGPGWLPSGRHFLLDKTEEDRVRYTGERPRPEATVYTVRNDTGDKRYFTIMDGQVVEHATYTDGFGAMLFEPHPTQGFEHAGRWCPYHRYSLCWAGYELYHPKSAEELAALRIARERRRTEREEEAWAARNPLLAWAEHHDNSPPAAPAE